MRYIINRIMLAIGLLHVVMGVAFLTGFLHASHIVYGIFFTVLGIIIVCSNYPFDEDDDDPESFAVDVPVQDFELVKG